MRWKPSDILFTTNYSTSCTCRVENFRSLRPKFKEILKPLNQKFSSLPFAKNKKEKKIRWQTNLPLSILFLQYRYVSPGMLTHCTDCQVLCPMQLLSVTITDGWKSVNTFPTNCTWVSYLFYPGAVTHLTISPSPHCQEAMGGRGRMSGRMGGRLPVLGKSFCLCRDLISPVPSITERHICSQAPWNRHQSWRHEKHHLLVVLWEISIIT